MRPYTRRIIMKPEAYTNNANFFLNNSAELIAEAHAEAKYSDPAVCGRIFGKFVSAAGLEKLAKAGMDAFEEKVGCSNVFPYNLIRTSMSNSVGTVGPVGRKFASDEAGAEIERYARFGGWLKAAAGLPAVTKVTHKTQSGRGVNSPYTTMSLWEIVRKHPSPHKFEKQLWAVKRRAEKILAAYSGECHPSWYSIAYAVGKTRSVGKAAVIAVAANLASAQQLGGKFGYKEARAFLTETRTAQFPIEDTTDGVIARREVEPRLVKGGIEVFRIRTESEYGTISLGWLVLGKGRSFHHHYLENETDALKAALAAWHQQAKLDREVRDSFPELLPNNMSILVFPADSRPHNAGNCVSGTDAWLERNGFSGCWYVPVKKLIPFSREERVMRVLKVVAKEIEKLAA